MFWFPIRHASGHGLRFRIDYDLCNQSFDLRIAKDTGNESFKAKPIEWEPLTPSGDIFPPTLSIRDH